MKIAVIGLGLIGGSVAKAFKKFTDCDILGYDRDERVLNKAVAEKTIDGQLGNRLPECDVVILGLYPEAAIKFVKENAEKISKDTIVSDVGGIKKRVCDSIYPIAAKHGFTFIGMHPMAGIEKSGYDFSRADMFSGASLVLTPYPDTPDDKLELLKNIMIPLGFGKIQISTPEEHDRIIAYTSQLAHVVSSAYIKSPTAMRHSGFSAGSFRDMTRVAHLNETMWTELFLENKEYLSEEIDTVISNLSDFSSAIKGGNKEKLWALLRDGREKKDLSDSLK
ncbi:MAG: prephenate dehydrogenase [Clostridiales bacterium]|nr:prephenate dehydrogenase [Clostridiales bacterium]